MFSGDPDTREQKKGILEGYLLFALGEGDPGDEGAARGRFAQAAAAFPPASPQNQGHNTQPVPQMPQPRSTKSCATSAFQLLKLPIVCWPQKQPRCSTQPFWGQTPHGLPSCMESENAPNPNQGEISIPKSRRIGFSHSWVGQKLRSITSDTMWWIRLIH